MNLRRFLHIALSATTTAICMLAVPTTAQNQSGGTSLSAPRPQAPPPWAYIVSPPAPPGAQAAPADNTPRYVLGSSVGITPTQLRDLYSAPDWRPGDHPPMPEVVARGRRPDLFACGYCHMPNGQGRPENSSLAGLSAGYIAQQMADYRNGLRKSSEPTMRPPALMVANAKSANEAEVKIAAGYFASLQYKPWIRVVETETVPKTRVSGGPLVPLGDGSREPIGRRIIEVPEDVARTDLRDPASGFIAYVPVGSIGRGEMLVTTGGAGRTSQCATCHGQDLKGVGDVPPLAGRSPSYTVRQLYDFQSGARAGLLSPQMKETVAKLTVDDMVSITAYTASRAP